MVGQRRKLDRTILDRAIETAEQRSSGRIGVIVTPRSADYEGYILFYGMVLGSVVATFVWLRFHSAWPYLVLIQFACLSAIFLFPPLRSLSIRCVPKAVRLNSSADAAYRHGAIIHAEPTEPRSVLLFVSLAERHVHLVPNPRLGATPATAWGPVTQQFSRTMKAQGLQAACLEAVASIGETLA